ncbi:MAG: DUF1990 domain-containing protein [Proteobacteria bacterium]|nr:DUF1990 domain-containing protein [Pseudomonadota bacterium]
MFYLRRPHDTELRSLAHERRWEPFTYPNIGATHDLQFETPPGYVVDRYGVTLGYGRDCFERARRAVQRFDMYPPQWTSVHFPYGISIIDTGLLFVAVVRHFGFYSALPCRIVYKLDDSICDPVAVHNDPTTGVENGDRGVAQVYRFGFALGTLPGHAESGEERFWVSWDPHSDTVRYDVVAFSRPHAVLARLGYPLTRMLQQRFARDSLANMVRVVG